MTAGLPARHPRLLQAPARAVIFAAVLGVLACVRPLTVVDYWVDVEVEATVEDATHKHLEGVLVLFVKGASSPVELGRTNEAGFASGRQTFLWGVREGATNPPPISFTVVFQQAGYREVRQQVLVADLPKRDGFSVAELRVVLLPAGQEGAV